MKAIHRVLEPHRGDRVNAGLCALAVMTKAPQAGRVKTRLSPPLSPQEAAALNICFLQDTTAAISRAAQRTSALGVAVYTPVGAEAAYVDILPADFVLVPQRGELFGERLAAATEDLLALGFDAVCLIDSDSPTLPESAFAQAVDFLSRPEDSVVLGPSDDGGYYLIGLKKLHEALFQGIDWSTERVFDQTVAAARRIGLPFHVLPTWYDVDERTTLSRLCAECFGSNGDRADAHPAPATRRFLGDLIEREGRARIWPDNV
jgi:hypothetical protein